MSDNSRRCLYPFLKIGLVQRPAAAQPARPLCRCGRRRLKTEPPAGAGAAAPRRDSWTFLLTRSLRPRDLPPPASLCHPPPPPLSLLPLSPDPSRVRVRFARCILKREIPLSSIKMQPWRAGRSCVCAWWVRPRASFAGLGKNPALLVSGLGALQLRLRHLWRRTWGDENVNILQRGKSS